MKNFKSASAKAKLKISARHLWYFVNRYMHKYEPCWFHCIFGIKCKLILIFQCTIIILLKMTSTCIGRWKEQGYVQICIRPVPVKTDLQKSRFFSDSFFCTSESLLLHVPTWFRQDSKICPTSKKKFFKYSLKKEKFSYFLLQKMVSW